MLSEEHLIVVRGYYCWFNQLRSRSMNTSSEIQQELQLEGHLVGHACWFYQERSSSCTSWSHSLPPPLNSTNPMDGGTRGEAC